MKNAPCLPAIIGRLGARLETNYRLIDRIYRAEIKIDLVASNPMFSATEATFGEHFGNQFSLGHGVTGKTQGVGKEPSSNQQGGGEYCHGGHGGLGVVLKAFSGGERY